MSYASGIGGLQRGINTITPSEAKPIHQATVPDSAANPGEVQNANVVHADQTSLSAISGLVAQALEGSDIRSAKVASLQQAITSGNYNVSSSDVADKIIQSLLD